MIKSRDVDFLLERVTEELSFADDCRDVSAAQAHRQMAALYAERLSELRGQGDGGETAPFIASV